MKTLEGKGPGFWHAHIRKCDMRTDLKISCLPAAHTDNFNPFCFFLSFLPVGSKCPAFQGWSPADGQRDYRTCPCNQNHSNINKLLCSHPISVTIDRWQKGGLHLHSYLLWDGRRAGILICISGCVLGTSRWLFPFLEHGESGIRTLAQGLCTEKRWLIDYFWLFNIDNM